MMPIWISAIVAGLALLVWGSDRFVLGASVTARNLGVPPLLVGLTVVGVGTSVPEILIGAVAALNGNPGVPVGNAVGSNIANLLPVLAVPALIDPGPVDAAVLSRDMPVMTFMSVAFFLMAPGYRRPGRINRLEGAALLAAFAAYQGMLLFSSRI